MTKEIKIALLMAASLFMEIMDGTIVTTALPSMAKYFRTESSTVALLVSIYLITVAIFIPLSGWLANRFGRKRMWLLAVGLFTLSSLGSALAPTLAILLGMRVIQGMSGAMMTPTARLIVLEKTVPSQLLQMTSYLVWPALIAPAVAPLIGGLIVTWWNWRLIFMINLPMGIVIILIGLFLIDQNTQTMAHHKFDVTGFIEIAIASGLILSGAELATHGRFEWLLAALMVVAGAGMLVFSYFHLRKVKNPLFSVSSLQIESFRFTQTGGSVLWLSVGAMPYLMTVYLQTIFHWSPVKASSFVIFIFLGNIAIKPFTTVIIKMLKYRGALFNAFLMVMISSFCLAIITKSTWPWLIALLAFVSGIGRSLALTAYNGLTFADVPLSERNSANTLASVIMTLAQGLGVSLITVLVSIFSQSMTLEHAYQFGFVFLGVLMLWPMLELLTVSKSIGESTF
ncbi:MFS transporter [Lactiplantibacillus plantarum]|uniref:MFS transporter n=1 Tax=Lactiplantibacillus plantarum TaxID=1590 RepID=UPI001BA6C788|nr:MFS transporter [Lactiplantibacillus plantarum]MBS0938032.1 MFS transporter [Lactiplantibacillus plantarum]MBS0945663.1 MFS transporter [Lactiplantibacillus plantarum]